jgi:hypothetical protein
MTERDAFGNPIEDAQPSSQPLTSGDPLRTPAAVPSGSAGPEVSLGIPFEPAEAAQPSAPAPTPDLYLVLFTILDRPRWSAYFTGGAAFQGDAHGRIVRRIQ